MYYMFFRCPHKKIRGEEGYFGMKLNPCSLHSKEGSVVEEANMWTDGRMDKHHNVFFKYVNMQIKSKNRAVGLLTESKCK